MTTNAPYGMVTASVFDARRRDEANLKGQLRPVDGSLGCKTPVRAVST